MAKGVPEDRLACRQRLVTGLGGEKKKKSQGGEGAWG